MNTDNAASHGEYPDRISNIRYTDIIGKSNPKPIYFITAENEFGEPCFFFLQCSRETMRKLQQSTEDIDLYSPEISIIRQGLGVPTELDLEYMKKEHNFSPDDNGRSR